MRLKVKYYIGKDCYRIGLPANFMFVDFLKFSYLIDH